MTDVEILREAIEKAKSLGWLIDGLRIKKYGVEEYLKTYFICDLANKVSGELYTHKSLYDIIFSHLFAKAFWKEEDEDEYNIEYGHDWKYHLQEMVLEENPLQYLAKFLDKEDK